MIPGHTMAKNKKRRPQRRKSRLGLVLLGLILAAVIAFSGQIPWENLCGILPSTPAPDPTVQMEIHMIDVGQGESILVRCGTETMLVDAGLRESGDDVSAYLRAQGIKKLDRLVISHDHSDHRGGLQRVLRDIDTNLLMLYDGGDRETGYLLAGDLAGSSACDIAFLEAGQQFPLGNATVTVVFPRAGYTSDDLNDTSLVLLVECDGKRVLLTADSTAAAEWLYYEDLPQVDVLKVAHHGSGGSTTTELLQQIKPKLALISCGENNDYGHPHKRVLQDLQHVGAAVYRTDLQGDLVVTLQDGAFSVKTQR